MDMGSFRHHSSCKQLHGLRLCNSWRSIAEKDLLLVALSRCVLNPLFLKVIILQLSEYEMFLCAVERIQEFTKIPRECTCNSSNKNDDYDWLVDWPNEGTIVANNLKLRYGDGPIVL